MPNEDGIVAIIPAYNEAETIGSVIDEVQEYVEYIVVIDDKSSDDTERIAREHGAVVIEHAVNTGVGGALRTGYKFAIDHGFEYVVQIDADGQHDPTYIPELLAVAPEFDIVIASRYLNQSFRDYSFVRRMGIRFFTAMVNILGSLSISDVTSGFRVYKVSSLKQIVHRSNRHWAIEQTLEAANREFSIEEVSVEMPTRHAGESQFDLQTLLLYPIRMTDVFIRILIFR